MRFAVPSWWPGNGGAEPDRRLSRLQVGSLEGRLVLMAEALIPKGEGLWLRAGHEGAGAQGSAGEPASESLQVAGVWTGSTWLFELPGELPEALPFEVWARLGRSLRQVVSRNPGTCLASGVLMTGVAEIPTLEPRQD